jgi:hypothetical protein
MVESLSDCNGGSVGFTLDSTACTKYQQSVAECCFVGLRFWERDGYEAVGREVDEEGIETEGPTAGRTVVAGTGPSSGTGRLGGPTPHLAATGPVSSDAGMRVRFGRFGMVALVDFRFKPLAPARG